MAIRIYMHPLSKHFQSQGRTVKGMARVWGFNPPSFCNTVYSGSWNEKYVKKLRDEGLYKLLTPEVRAKLEKKEKERNGK